MDSIEKKLDFLRFDGIEANFRVVMPLAVPRLGPYRALLSDLNERLRLQPGSARLYAIRGKILSNLGQYGQACRALEKALALDRSCVEARVWLGQVHLLENRIDASVWALTEALALDPACAWAYFYRGAAHYVMGRPDWARRNLTLALRRQNGEAEIAARALLGLIDAKSGRVKDARSHINQVVAHRRGQAWPYVLRAAVRRFEGDFPAALRDLDTALRGRPQAWIYLERAGLRETLGRREEALEDVERAGRLAGVRGQAFFLHRGRLRLALGRQLEALKDLRRAWRLGFSADLKAFALDLARQLKEAGREVQSKEILRRLKRAFPRSREIQSISLGIGRRLGRNPSAGGGEIEGLLARFQRALRQGDYEQAERCGEAVLDRTRRRIYLEGLAAPFLPAYDGAALPRTRVKLLGRVMRRLQRYISSRPGSPWGYFLRYQWKAALGQPQERGDLRRLAAFRASRYGWMRALAAHDLLYRGRFREAIRQFRVARDFSRPPDWRCQCYIAEALACLGDLPAAWKAFRTARRWAAERQAEVAAWQAEVLLWSGRYRQALRLLNAIPKGSLSPYALCWKGAALCLLGRRSSALAALTGTLARFPRDCEARVWKAEVLLRMGRAAQARRQADEALRLAPQGNDFAYAVRGLACAALGDEAGLRADVRRLSRQARRAASRHLGNSFGGRDEAAVLEKVLELGLGNRRMDVPLRLGQFL